jgi:Putative papain-like cysteine peptidase (DUF1796)
MTEAISLGWNCSAAIHGVNIGIRTRKEHGYKTCPFDEMITNYEGMIQCIEDDFKYFCDDKYLEIIKIPKESPHLNTDGSGDLIIYNSKYRFLLSHEYCHANLYISQKWEYGADHFIMNNYQNFKIRYERRIQNMKNLLNSGKFIRFILARPNTTSVNDIPKLNNTIKNKYPTLQYDFVFLDTDRSMFYDCLRLMKLDENEDEVKRLNSFNIV